MPGMQEGNAMSTNERILDQIVEEVQGVIA